MKKSSIILVTFNLKKMETLQLKKVFFDRWYFPLIIVTIFSLIFTGLYFLYRDTALISSWISQNINIANIFSKYWVYVGWALGLISMIWLYFIFFIKFIFWLRKLNILNPFVYIIVYGVLFWLGYFLAYFEPRYTDIGRWIIDYFSQPLMYASWIILVFSIVWCMYIITRKISWKK